MNFRRLSFTLSLLFFILLFLSCCSTVGNSELTIQFDQNFSENTDNSFSITLSNAEKGDFSYAVPSNGQLMIEEIPKGIYQVTVKRFNQEDTLELNINKRHLSVDMRLFYDNKGSALEGNHYIISTSEQLLNIKKISRSDEVIYYHLLNDIDFTGVTVEPFDDFSGVLDGRNYGVTSGMGYKVKGLSISEDDDNVGLFRVNNGEIRNISFNDCSVSGKNNVGVIAGENSGIISYCDVTGSVNADNYGGGIAGVDRGSISDCNSTALINCSGYYGRIAGISYSDMTLGAYGIKPSLAGATPITEEMSALNKYLTAVDNWYAMNERAVLQTAEIKADLTETAGYVINTVRLALPKGSLERLLLSIIYDKEISATEKIIIRRIYEGGMDEGLNKLLVSGGGYTASTSFDNIINSIMAIPELKEMLNNIDLKFPFGFAAYYSEDDNERMELQITDNAYVTEDGKVSYTLGDTVYTVNITDDLNEYASENGLTSYQVTTILSYIAEIKERILNLTVLDLNVADAVKEVYDETYSNGYYRFKMTVDPDKALKYIFDRIQLAMDTEFEGTSGEGTTINTEYAQDITFTVEVWDNGNLKSVKIENLDVKVTVDLTPETEEELRQFVSGIDFDNDGSGGDINNFTLDKVSVSLSGSLRDSYSYSRTDTDIDIYLTEFDKDKIRLIDAIEEER